MRRRIEFGKQAEFSDAADPGLEHLSDMVGVVGGEMAVGAAFGVGCPPLAFGNLLTQQDRGIGCAQRLPASTQPKGLDQCPVDGKVGIAADGAGKVGIAAQARSKWPILRGA